MKTEKVLKDIITLSKEEATNLNWVIRWYNNNWQELRKSGIDVENDLYYIIEQILKEAIIEGD